MELDLQVWKQSAERSVQGGGWLFTGLPAAADRRKGGQRAASGDPGSAAARVVCATDLHCLEQVPKLQCWESR